MEIIFLVIGLVLGVVIGWFVAKGKSSSTEGVSIDRLQTGYVSKDIYESLKKEHADAQLAREHTTQELMESNKLVTQFQEKSKHFEERIVQHKEEMTALQSTMQLQFKNLSNQIFEEKSSKFLELNEKKVFDILNPLKERIQDFEKKVDDTHKDEIRERASLKKELSQIMELNKKLSEDAVNLTNALKGDKKLQGDWGEVQLEMILNKAGLEKDIHYRKQPNYKDEDGNNQRPDYIINLPDDKNLVLDSKVSLVAYEQYFNAENEVERESHLKTHIQNILAHIRDLGNKNYQKLMDINPPDYVLMFVPIEPALYLSLKEDSGLFDKALDKNIVLVTTSTLLATLRTISFIWKQDNQQKNVAQIAKESGELYDKFVLFMEDLVKIGNRLDGAKEEYSKAMNKLIESKQKGATIIGRMERIKKLGANTTKSLPDSLLNRLDNNETNDA